MSELDKVLEWSIENRFYDNVGDMVVNLNDLKSFIDSLKNPPKKLVWQCQTRSTFPDWRTITDDEHEIFQHISRFTFRQIELQ